MTRFLGIGISICCLLMLVPIAMGQSQREQQPMFGLPGFGLKVDGLAMPYTFDALSFNPQPLQPIVLYGMVIHSVLFIQATKSLDGRGEGGLGSAVAIAPDVAMTNCHVVMYREGQVLKDMGVIVAQKKETQPIRVFILDRFTDIDICLIGAPGASFQAVRTIGNFAFLNEGQTVYTLGNPAGLNFTFANGIISALRPNMTTRNEFNEIHADMIQTTAPISGGSSGGALFDVFGNLIGITQSLKENGQNLNFAIAADLLWRRYGKP